MKYNILIDTPPDTFGGVKVKTDYRQVFEFFRIVSDEKKSDIEKAQEILNVFFDELPKFDNDRLWEFIEYYISMGCKTSAESSERLFDWDIDSGRVYAAFIQAYKIDLTKERMHWWTFRTLFDALPDGSKLMDIIKIRGMKRPTGKDRESAKERMRIDRLKAQFALDKED